VTVDEVEKAVFALEHVRIVFRCPARTIIGDFAHQKPADGKYSISQWKAQRLTPIAHGNDIVAINGRGEVVHGLTRMENLRSTYAPRN